MSIRNFLLVFDAPISECRFYFVTDGETKYYSDLDIFSIVDFNIRIVTVEKSDKFDITFYE